MAVAGLVAAAFGTGLVQVADKVLAGVGGNYVTQLLQRVGWFTPAGTLRDVGWLLLVIAAVAVLSISVPSVLAARSRSERANVGWSTDVSKTNAHVFICASAKDDDLASAVCAELERKGVTCWLADRDLAAGEVLGARVSEAILKSHIVMLLFTTNANRDSRVHDDLGYARKHDARILPIRFEDSDLDADLDHMTARLQWFDATQRPFGAALNSLASLALKMLGEMGVRPSFRYYVPRAPPRMVPILGLEDSALWRFPLRIVRAIRRAWNRVANVVINESDVEREACLPVLASIPTWPKRTIPDSVRAQALEPYFQLVLAMRYSAGKSLGSVTITSPHRRDGRSTIAINVAAAFGEIALAGIEGEVRVLIIDADMRHPSLHVKLAVPNWVGLSDVIDGRVILSKATQRTSRPGLDVLTSGPRVTDSLVLLRSQNFAALLREVRQHYAIVIIDTPPLVRDLDAEVVAARTDGTLLVVSAGSTSVGSIRRSWKLLEGAGGDGLLGVAVNRATEMAVYDAPDWVCGSDGVLYPPYHPIL